MQRAYSVLQVKALSDGARTFEGIATTPSTDRMGDQVDPMGAKIALPLPLLLHHDGQRPVGIVASANATRAGITVRCQIAQPEDAGVLRSRCDEAWHSIKAGVIRGLSIGFRALEDGVQRLNTGGLRFADYEILELSLTAIPANSEATITSVKHYDALRRGSGRKGVPLLLAARSRW